MNRLKEGFVCVRNPYRRNSVSKITLSPQTVDCIVFWTKNPSGILEYLPQIANMGYRYYFQFTLTPYDGTIEKGVADKEMLVQTFQRLSNMIGKLAADNGIGIPAQPFTHQLKFFDMPCHGYLRSQ